MLLSFRLKRKVYILILILAIFTSSCGIRSPQLAGVDSYEKPNLSYSQMNFIIAGQSDEVNGIKISEDRTVEARSRVLFAFDTNDRVYVQILIFSSQRLENDEKIYLSSLSYHGEEFILHTLEKTYENIGNYLSDAKDKHDVKVEINEYLTKENPYILLNASLSKTNKSATLGKLVRPEGYFTWNFVIEKGGLKSDTLTLAHEIVSEEQWATLIT